MATGKSNANADNVNQVLDDSKNIVNNADELLNEIKNAQDSTAPISASTVTSLVVSVVVVINAILAIFGIDKQLDQNTWYQIGSVIALVANIGYATWHNHNITKDARQRQQIGEAVVPKKSKGNK